MVRDLEQSRSPGGSDIMLSKLRERLREKEKALEVGLLSQDTPPSLSVCLSVSLSLSLSLSVSLSLCLSHTHTWRLLSLASSIFSAFYPSVVYK